MFGETVKAEHTVAEVQWFKQHDDRYYDSQSDSCSVWVVLNQMVLNHFPMQHTEKHTLKRIVSLILSLEAQEQAGEILS